MIKNFSLPLIKNDGGATPLISSIHRTSEILLLFRTKTQSFDLLRKAENPWTVLSARTGICCVYNYNFIPKVCFSKVG